MLPQSYARKTAVAHHVHSLKHPPSITMRWEGNAVDAVGGAGVLARGTSAGNSAPRAAPSAASPVCTVPRPCLHRPSLLARGRPSPACRPPPRHCSSVKQPADAPQAGERPPCWGSSRCSSVATTPKAAGRFGKAIGRHGESRAVPVAGRSPPRPALAGWDAATRSREEIHLRVGCAPVARGGSDRQLDHSCPSSRRSLCLVNAR